MRALVTRAKMQLPGAVHTETLLTLKPFKWTKLAVNNIFKYTWDRCCLRPERTTAREHSLILI